MLNSEVNEITKINFLLLLKTVEKLTAGLNVDIGTELNAQTEIISQRFNTIDNELIEIQGKLENTQELFINNAATQQLLSLESNWVNGNYVGAPLAVIPGQIFINSNYYYLIGLDFKPIRLLKDSRLTTIESKIDTLLYYSNPNQEITFTPLTLNPTYETNASHGWATSPTNLENLYDNNNNTASNLFEINGSPWGYGEVIMKPNIPMPNFSKIYFKVGLQTWSGQRAEWELAVFDIIRQVYRNVWNYNGNSSQNQDLIAEIDIIVPFQWEMLRFRLIDVGVIAPRARFYDLKVWEVS